MFAARWVLTTWPFLPGLLEARIGRASLSGSGAGRAGMGAAAGDERNADRGDEDRCEEGRVGQGVRKGMEVFRTDFPIEV